MSYDKEMIERDELVERVANILENMPECHGLSSVKILALTRAAVAECEKELATLRSAFADERALRVEQIEMRQSIEAQAAEMRTALRELSGQIIQGRVGFGLAVCPSLDPILAQTELALSTDAGRKVLDVVRAVGKWRDLFEPGAVEATVKIDAERRILMALSALGWKP